MQTIAKGQIFFTTVKLLGNGMGASDGGELPVQGGFSKSGWSWIRNKIGKIQVPYQ